MKICPTCLAHHDDRFARCPADGAALLPLGAEPDPRVGTVVGGAYVILDVLGAGGMGVVYRAWQRSTEREVAIKTLHSLTGEAAEMMAARFLREARVTASLRSPNTVTIHDFGQLDDGDLYLVMELLHGIPADVLLETRGALPLGLVREIGAQVCRSLAEAHARSVVHRDLKPSNLVLESTPTGELHVKVLDFGVAKLLEEGTMTLTTTGTTVGTVAYMSPEQVEGTGAVGPASDLYSLGVTLFELATGDRPFVADSRLALMFKHASEPPPPLSRYLAPSPEVGQLEKILDQCLAKAPADRFRSADALLRALVAPPLGGAPTDGAPAPRAASPPDSGPPTVDGPLPSAIAAGLKATAGATQDAVVTPAPSSRDTRRDEARPVERGSSRRGWIPFVAGVVVAGVLALGVGLLSGPRTEAPAPEAAAPDAAVVAAGDAPGALDAGAVPDAVDAAGATPAGLDTSAVAEVTAAIDVVAERAPELDTSNGPDDTAPVEEERDTRRATPPPRREPHEPPRDTYTPPADTSEPGPSPAPDPAPAPSGPRTSDVRVQGAAPNTRAVVARLVGLVERCAARERGLAAGGYRVNFVLLRTGALHSVRLSPGDGPARGVEACVQAGIASAPFEALGGRSDTRVQMTLRP